MTTDTTASSAAEATDSTVAATATDAATTTDATAAVAATVASTETVASAPSTPIAAAVPQVTLRHFAMDVSSRDKRVALLHGFIFEETKARRFKDTEANYQARFVQFANQPV